MARNLTRHGVSSAKVVSPDQGRRGKEALLSLQRPLGQVSRWHETMSHDDLRRNGSGAPTSY